MEATIAVSKQMEFLKDVPRAIQDALVHPFGTLPLRELAQPGERVCIVFTDSTRASPDHLLVAALLNELFRCVERISIEKTPRSAQNLKYTLEERKTAIRSQVV